MFKETFSKNIVSRNSEISSRLDIENKYQIIRLPFKGTASSRFPRSKPGEFRKKLKISENFVNNDSVKEPRVNSPSEKLLENNPQTPKPREPLPEEDLLYMPARPASRFEGSPERRAGSPEGRAGSPPKKLIFSPKVREDEVEKCVKDLENSIKVIEDSSLVLKVKLSTHSANKSAISSLAKSNKSGHVFENNFFSTEVRRGSGAYSFKPLEIKKDNKQDSLDIKNVESFVYDYTPRRDRPSEYKYFTPTCHNGNPEVQTVMSKNEQQSFESTIDKKEIYLAKQNTGSSRKETFQSERRDIGSPKNFERGKAHPIYQTPTGAQLGTKNPLKNISEVKYNDLVKSGSVRGKEVITENVKKGFPSEDSSQLLLIEKSELAQVSNNYRGSEINQKEIALKSKTDDPKYHPVSPGKNDIIKKILPSTVKFIDLRPEEIKSKENKSPTKFYDADVFNYSKPAANEPTLESKTLNSKYSRNLTFGLYHSSSKNARSLQTVKANSRNNFILKNSEENQASCLDRPPNYYVEKLQKSVFSTDEQSQAFKSHFLEGMQYFDLLIGRKIPEKGRVLLDKANKKKTLVFDLDETLIHSSNETKGRDFDVTLDITTPEHGTVNIGFYIRPHAREILEELSQHFEIIIYTASHESYAKAILQYLDPMGSYIQYVLDRRHCLLIDDGLYIKDLRILESSRDLKNLLLIDNAFYSFCLHIPNGVPILPCYESNTDRELFELKNYLLSLAEFDDLREANSKIFGYYNFSQYRKQFKDAASS